MCAAWTNTCWGCPRRFRYPGKLIIAGRIADKEAEAARLRYEAAVRDALSDAKEAYFELYYIDRAQQVTGEIKKLYDRYAALAVGRHGSGQAQLPETFRAESQRAQLGYDLVLLSEMRAAEAERLRAVLGLPAQAERGPRRKTWPNRRNWARRWSSSRKSPQQHNQELAAAGVEVAARAVRGQAGPPRGHPGLDARRQLHAHEREAEEDDGRG